ncbi:MAG: EamA family transporter RarD [Planctomycetota bacterium]
MSNRTARVADRRQSTPSSADPRRGRRGVAYGIAAYGLWGMIPLYFKAVERVAPLELLAHRAFWSCVVLALLVVALGRWRSVVVSLRKPRLAALLGASTLLIGLNWLTFIYAVVTDQVLQSSLGYFITPIVNVLLGVLLLGERLRPLQLVSLALVVFGVVVRAVLLPGWPWVALVLALSFAFYGLLRKTMPVDGLTGLTVETLLLSPMALAYLAYLSTTGGRTGDNTSLWLLALSGPVTTVPLLFFVAAARGLRLSTLGFLQYLTPTGQFCVALAYGEPFTWPQGVSFGLIWIAVGIYTFDSLRRSSPRPPALEPE